MASTSVFNVEICSVLYVCVYNSRATSNRLTATALIKVQFLSTVSPQESNHRVSDPPSGQGAADGTQICNRRVRADLRAGSLPKRS
ncbi:hypothetical protein PoB_002031900 [Plakobranchus ocellatus]|uniref:Uncharacterized protein n=1 Tax=Plakobranchus ocellatus TaxID=259542 RepID=A0AAV3ZHF1_9GAST|nr:hypothetical protein PoB_002031900 [Plakobranchus ocellatus]